MKLRDDRRAPKPVRAGVDFVGWRTWWTHRTPRAQTLRNLEERLAGYRRQLVRRTAMPGVATIRLPLGPTRARFKGDAAPLVRLRSTLATCIWHPLPAPGGASR